MKNVKIMEKVKMVVGFLLAALAATVGFEDGTVMFMTLASMAGAVYAISEVIKLKWTWGGVQLITWVVGIGLAFIGWWLQLGIFFEMLWYYVPVTGFAAALIANGIFDAGFIQAIWAILVTKKTASV